MVSKIMRPQQTCTFEDIEPLKTLSLENIGGALGVPLARALPTQTPSTPAGYEGGHEKFLCSL